MLRKTLQAIQEDELPWINLSDLEGVEKMGLSARTLKPEDLEERLVAIIHNEIYF